MPATTLVPSDADFYSEEAGDEAHARLIENILTAAEVVPGNMTLEVKEELRSLLTQAQANLEQCGIG